MDRRHRTALAQTRPILRPVVAVGTAIAALALLAACGSAADGTRGGAGGSPGTLTVLTTTTQLADFARQVGGAQVTVTSLAKPGVDVHDVEPGAVELEALRGADVVVRNGLGIDGWLDDAFEAAGAKGVLIDASDGIVARMHDGEEDPHIWFDPRNAQRMVTTISDAFATADPDGGADYRAALERYRTALGQLDADIGRAVATVTSRKVVTNHDAFGYFLDRYGLQFVGSIIPSFDSTAELSAADVTDLVAKIRAEGVVAVFSEASIPPKTAAAIARDAGVEVIGGEDALYGDALGPSGSTGETYLGMMRHNARVMVEALGGNGPGA